MSEKYALIAAERADPTSPYPEVKMCAWLEVSTSGFYDHCNAEPSARELRRTKITAHLQAAYELGRGGYGVRRVLAVLKRSDDPEVASANYEYFVERVIPRVPYVSERGLQAVLDLARQQNPQGANAKVQDFMDNRFIKELEDSGFIKTLYGK